MAVFWTRFSSGPLAPKLKQCLSIYLIVDKTRRNQASHLSKIRSSYRIVKKDKYGWEMMMVRCQPGPNGPPRAFFWNGHQPRFFCEGMGPTPDRSTASPLSEPPRPMLSRTPVPLSLIHFRPSTTGEMISQTHSNFLPSVRRHIKWDIRAA
jgi:hypothetical protein